MGTEINCDEKRCRYQVDNECARGEIEMVSGSCITQVIE